MDVFYALYIIHSFIHSFIHSITLSLPTDLAYTILLNVHSRHKKGSLRVCLSVIQSLCLSSPHHLFVSYHSFIKEGFVVGTFTYHSFIKEGFVVGTFTYHSFIKEGFVVGKFTYHSFVVGGFVVGTFTYHSFIKEGFVVGTFTDGVFLEALLVAGDALHHEVMKHLWRGAFEGRIARNSGQEP